MSPDKNQTILGLKLPNAPRDWLATYKNQTILGLK